MYQGIEVLENESADHTNEYLLVVAVMMLVSSGLLIEDHFSKSREVSKVI